MSAGAIAVFLLAVAVLSTVANFCRRAYSAWHREQYETTLRAARLARLRPRVYEPLGSDDGHVCELCGEQATWRDASQGTGSPQYGCERHRS